MLLGHQIGLASAYYRPSDEEMLDSYLIAFNNLTINEENQLRRQVEIQSRKVINGPNETSDRTDRGTD